jgi:hypothetical protein
LIKSALVLVVAALVIARLFGAFGGLDTPDADHQKATETACLPGAGLDVTSEIPPYIRGGVTPGWRLEVLAKRNDEHLAWVYLFDDKDSAKDYADEQKSFAQDNPPPKGVKIEQRGPEVVRLYADAAQEAIIRGCVDKAIKPPPGKKATEAARSTTVYAVRPKRRANDRPAVDQRA